MYICNYISSVCAYLPLSVCVCVGVSFIPPQSMSFRDADEERLLFEGDSHSSRFRAGASNSQEKQSGDGEGDEDGDGERAVREFAALIRAMTDRLQLLEGAVRMVSQAKQWTPQLQSKSSVCMCVHECVQVRISCVMCACTYPYVYGCAPVFVCVNARVSVVCIR